MLGVVQESGPLSLVSSPDNLSKEVLTDLPADEHPECEVNSDVKTVKSVLTHLTRSLALISARSNQSRM
jgi:hypothetical protein